MVSTTMLLRRFGLLESLHDPSLLGARLVDKSSPVDGVESLSHASAVLIELRSFFPFFDFNPGPVGGSFLIWFFLPDCCFIEHSFFLEFL